MIFGNKVIKSALVEIGAEIRNTQAHSSNQRAVPTRREINDRNDFFSSNNLVKILEEIHRQAREQRWLKICFCGGISDLLRSEKLIKNNLWQL